MKKPSCDVRFKNIGLLMNCGLHSGGPTYKILCYIYSLASHARP